MFSQLPATHERANSIVSALALTEGSDSAENIYWVSALIRVSQQLCHSENNPVQMGR
jgi:hypothetical protein